MSSEITLRFFAAAAEAVGAETLRVALPAGAAEEPGESADHPTRLDAVLDRLPSPPASAEGVGTRAPDAPSWETVRPRCSFLVDGVRARPEAVKLSGGETVDVLPPFAGG